MISNKNYQVWATLKLLKMCLKQTIKTGANNASVGKLTKFLKVITINQMDDFVSDWEERLVHSMLEVLELNRDLDALAKVIDFEKNPMTDSDEARRMLTTACQVFCERSDNVCRLEIVN